MEAQPFTQEELRGILNLVMQNRDKVRLQKVSGIGYIQSINLKNKLTELIDQLPTKTVLVPDIFDISFNYKGEQALVIEDTQNDITYNIPIDLLHEGKIANYNIVDRLNERDEIERLLGESKKESDKNLMREDVEYLNSSAEEFVLANYDMNGFIAKDVEPERFNKVCQELIESYQEATGIKTTAAQYNESEHGTLSELVKPDNTLSLK